MKPPEYRIIAAFVVGVALAAVVDVVVEGRVEEDNSVASAAIL